MNAKQRNNNRKNAQILAKLVREKRLSEHICENCGEPGGHWVAMPQSLEEIMGQQPEQGFWTCSKYYDPQTGRRLEEHVDPRISGVGGLEVAMGSILGVMLGGCI